MDSAEYRILNLIDFDSSAENKAEAIAYLQKLRNYKKENLKKDSVNLKDDLNNIDLQTQEIAFSNYSAFIKTAESSRQVLKGWNETTKVCQSLIETLPDFSKKCDEFVKTTWETQSSSRLNSLTMKRHVDLLEILELPQLMESSIRDEKYEDALELASYVQKLGTKFENVSFFIINSIVKTIESSWHVMITQLLSELKCDLTLPKCLQIVGYLNRMQAFSTSELKLKFLQTRDSWFKEILSAIPKADSHQHLTKTIELTRVNLFNIVTQYKALFDDDFGIDSTTKENLIFNSWLHEKIDDFLRILEHDLGLCNTSLMDITTILGQCMYFGASFSRIGVDFRAQLAPIFLKVMTKYLNVSVIKATKQFEMDMERFTLINKDRTTFKRNIKLGDSVDLHADNPYSPPENLLDFRPLAVYCNALLNIFNELRICSPVAIIHPFINALEASLETVAKCILSFYRGEQQAFGIKEKENFLRMCGCFSFELIPYIQNCVNLIFPTNNKLAHNIEQLTTLKNEKILEPIDHLANLDQFATTKI